jgi:hypothetical protein
VQINGDSKKLEQSDGALSRWHFWKNARDAAAQQVYWPDFRFRFVTGL